jgi:hypothetical protein
LTTDFLLIGFLIKEEFMGKKIGIGIPNFILKFGKNGIHKRGGFKEVLNGRKGAADEFDIGLLFLLLDIILLAL